MICIIFSLSFIITLAYACWNKTYSNVQIGAHLLILYELCIMWQLVCRNNLTCNKHILHTLSIIQHVSAHDTCYQQGVTVAVIVTLSNGTMYILWANELECARVHNWEFIHLLYNGSFEGVITATKTHWLWHVWCAEICGRTDKVWRIYLVNIKLVLQTN